MTILKTKQTQRLFKLMNLLNNFLIYTNSEDSLISVEVVGGSLKIKLDDVFTLEELEARFNITGDDFVRRERNETITVWISL